MRRVPLADHLPGHLCARLCATPANCRTGLHLSIVAKPLAILCATLTDLGAHSACAPMKIGATEHEVGARLANLSTVQKKADVPLLCMPATLTKAVRYRLHTDSVTLFAIPNTLGHLSAHLTTCHMMDHGLAS